MNKSILSILLLTLLISCNSKKTNTSISDTEKLNTNTENIINKSDNLKLDIPKTKADDIAIIVKSFPFAHKISLSMYDYFNTLIWKSVLDKFEYLPHGIETNFIIQSVPGIIIKDFNNVLTALGTYKFNEETKKVELIINSDEPLHSGGSFY